MKENRLTCPVCQLTFYRKRHYRKHVFGHLSVLSLDGQGAQSWCWCGSVFQFWSWDEHLSNVGGLQAHYAACALGLEDKQ